MTKARTQQGAVPRGTVADHWTWRDGHAHATGWHRPKRGREPEPLPEVATPRGLVTTSQRRATGARERQGTLL